MTATAAPIFGPDGLLVGSVGILDSRQGPSRAKLLYLATTSVARRIAMELFAANFSRSRLMIASRDGRRVDALLAIDGDDRVVGATRAARELLGLTQQCLEAGFGARDHFGPPDDLARAQSRAIGQAMVRHANNRSAVARALGISRSTLYRKLAAGPPGLVASRDS